MATKYTSKYKAMGGGEAQGSLKAEHSHHAVYYVVGEFEVAIPVCDRAMFKEALWGSSISWWVTARGWGRLWGWSRGWGRWGRRWKRVRQRQSDGGVRWRGGDRCWGRRRGKRVRQRQSDGGIRWRRGGRGGGRRRCACAWARSLGDEVRQRRQREVGRVVVVVGLDRAKVSTITLGEPS